VVPASEFYGFSSGRAFADDDKAAAEVQLPANDGSHIGSVVDQHDVEGLGCHGVKLAMVKTPKPASAMGRADCVPSGDVAVTVLLVDDVVELRAVLRRALRLRGGFDVVAESGDGAGAIEAARLHQPDIVVLDLGLPDLAGQEVLTGLRTVAPSAQVVVYTGLAGHDRPALTRQVEAYVHKDQDIRYLVDLLGDLTRSRHRTATLHLGPDLGQVREARRFLIEQCQRWQCLDVIPDAELVISELVTNALVHAGPTCVLRARLAQGILRLEVRDEGDGMPDPLAADAQAEHGRGLLLVSALSTAWGVESVPDGGKLVWAELMCEGSPDAVEQATNSSCV
jgi:CheY-like chemotaxis protein